MCPKDYKQNNRIQPHCIWHIYAKYLYSCHVGIGDRMDFKQHYSYYENNYKLNFKKYISSFSYLVLRYGVGLFSA